MGFEPTTCGLGNLLCRFRRDTSRDVRGALDAPLTSFFFPSQFVVMRRKKSQYAPQDPSYTPQIFVPQTFGGDLRSIEPQAHDFFARQIFEGSFDPSNPFLEISMLNPRRPHHFQQINSARRFVHGGERSAPFYLLIIVENLSRHQRRRLVRRYNVDKNARARAQRSGQPNLIALSTDPLLIFARTDEAHLLAAELAYLRNLGHNPKLHDLRRRQLIFREFLLTVQRSRAKRDSQAEPSLVIRPAPFEVGLVIDELWAASKIQTRPRQIPERIAQMSRILKRFYSRFALTNRQHEFRRVQYEADTAAIKMYARALDRPEREIRKQWYKAYVAGRRAARVVTYMTRRGRRGMFSLLLTSYLREHWKSVRQAACVWSRNRRLRRIRLPEELGKVSPDVKTGRSPAGFLSEGREASMDIASEARAPFSLSPPSEAGTA